MTRVNIIMEQADVFAGGEVAGGEVAGFESRVYVSLSAPAALILFSTVILL